MSALPLAATCHIRIGISHVHEQRGRQHSQSHSHYRHLLEIVSGTPCRKPDNALNVSIVANVDSQYRALLTPISGMERTLDSSFDYIVVGGGSSGCLLAARLSENSSNKVLLVEAGRRDTSPLIYIPATFYRVLRAGRDAQVYASAPEQALNGRSFAVAQGHVLGGGSSVNAMIYIRGQAADYDNWAQMGCTGWSYNEVLATFRKLEGNERLHDHFHGTDGELKVSDVRFRHPLSKAFVRAAQESGIRATEDFNGARQDGVGFYQQTTYRGRRWNSAKAFLRGAEHRSNLMVVTQARVSRLRFSGARAVGIELLDGRAFGCHGEIVMTAGALATPKILQLSGVGNATHLKSHGIAVVADVPGVGENFQDHVEVAVQGRSKDPISMFAQDTFFKGIGHLLRYALGRKGLLSSNVVESGAFVDTVGTGIPDVQFHVTPAITSVGGAPPEPIHGISVNPCLLHPRSRGTVKLRSADPRDRELFISNALQDPEDVETLMRGIRLGIRILQSPALASLLNGRVTPKDADVRDDDALREYIRNVGKTVYHPAGTCRMGSATDPFAAVDPKLKLRGVENVRVCDASVMPTLVSGNTNAPTMMIAERAAGFILGDGR
jgi:choline dehydrogenase-like flavoprotein